MCRVRRTPRAPRRAAPVAVAPHLLLGLALTVAGCGRSTARGSGALTFEELPDSATLSHGEPLLNRLDATRLNGGAMVVRGALRLPDGTRIQLTVSDAATRRTRESLQTTVRAGAFETPPFMAKTGPLPAGRYRIELLAYFNAAWQPDDVLRATDNGRNLRGPGVQATRAGVILQLAVERTL